MSCGIGHRCILDLALLWLLCRLAAVALIQPLSWESPYAAGAALNIKKKKKNPKNKKQKKPSKLQMLLEWVPDVMYQSQIDHSMSGDLTVFP